MGAHPKRKTSTARAGKRRSHKAVKPPALIDCPQCHTAMLPHHACPTCGTYNGREVVKIEGPKRTAG